jgi:hypothetical protein
MPTPYIKKPYPKKPYAKKPYHQKAHKPAQKVIYKRVVQAVVQVPRKPNFLKAYRRLVRDHVAPITIASKIGKNKKANNLPVKLSNADKLGA